MARIDIATFGGMRPASAPQLLQAGEAQFVVGAELSSGELRHERGNLRVNDFTSEVKSFWFQDCRRLGGDEAWIHHADRRRYVNSRVDDDYGRVYMSREAGGLAVSAYVSDAIVEYSLGVHAPTVAPTIDGSVNIRTGEVSFDPDTDTFSFTGNALYIAPDMGISFSGDDIPSDIAANYAYVVLYEIDGKYVFADSESPNTPFVFAASGSATVTVQAEGSSQTRIYAFTLVNSLGEESAPGPMTRMITVDYSSTVTLSGLTHSNIAGYAPITAKRVYRLSTGDSGESGLVFVGEIAASATTYVDVLTDQELGEKCVTMNFSVPHAGLKGLRGLPDNVLVAHTDSEICFSESGYPYAWPTGYRYMVRGKIVALGVSGLTVFAFTDSVVHMLTVESPDVVTVTTLDGFIPCLCADGVAEGSQGVLFPSNDGLYQVAEGHSTATNVTDGLINETEWRALHPGNMLATFFDQAYVAFVDDGDYQRTLVLEFGTDGQARMRYLSMFGTAIGVSPILRRMFYVAKIDQPTPVWRLYHIFGQDESWVPLRWESGVFMTPGRVNMAAAIVETADLSSTQGDEEGWSGPIGESLAGSVPFAGEQTDAYPWEAALTTLSVTADGVERARLNVLPYRLMALPGGYTARAWEVCVTSFNKNIRRVAMATSTGEIQYG